jgi:hypothetical protein
MCDGVPQTGAHIACPQPLGFDQQVQPAGQSLSFTHVFASTQKMSSAQTQQPL